MKRFKKIIAALLVLVPVTAAADPLPKPVSDMECLVGSWKGGGSLTAGKDTAKLTTTWNCKRTSAQFGVGCTFQVTGIPGVAIYDETDLMGYEPDTKLYHWYSVTNAGETHDHVAKVPTGNTTQCGGEPKRSWLARARVAERGSRRSGEGVSLALRPDADRLCPSSASRV